MELEEQQENNGDNRSPSVSSPSHSNSTKKKKKKRTRDLPNLTQCHSCGFRIDSCSGNDSLQTLYSEWRIVLLCQNCFVGVESSNLCSYCFKSGSSDDCFSCLQCKHIIHKACFSSRVNVPPWSFSCSTTRFSICLDCWVPKLVADRRAYCSSKRKNPVVFYLGNCGKRLLENVVRDANSDTQRKVEAASRARELAVEKALGARRAGRLADKALGMIGDRDDNAVSGVDDVELAMGLHGAMNSSLKILKNFCSVSSNCLAVPNPLVINGSCRILEVSSGISSVPGMKEGEGGCSNKFLNSVSQNCRGDDGSIVPVDESNTQNFIKYAGRAFENVPGNRKPDRYMIKYTRRVSAHETYNPKTNRYLIKYARRTSVCGRYKGRCDRFGIKYTRSKLNQRPVLDRRSNCLNEALSTKLMLQLLN